jgi:hypothetical protein
MAVFVLEKALFNERLLDFSKELFFTLAVVTVQMFEFCGSGSELSQSGSYSNVRILSLPQVDPHVLAVESTSSFVLCRS